ncbi:MAG TPA: hypothetical protein VMS17_09345 [Gemmataceae bacterium]|nr:hypothetical protein [Gemmataceae bacterium]
MASKATASSGGIGVCGALGVAFVVLKLCGVIDWSWLWVLAPFWIPPMVVGLVLGAFFTAAAAQASARKSVAGRCDGGVRRLHGSVYEPIHGWTKPQLDDYLARNPGYRSAYEVKLQGRQ